jgi:hypothetical protein
MIYLYFPSSSVLDFITCLFITQRYLYWYSWVIPVIDYSIHIWSGFFFSFNFRFNFVYIFFILLNCNFELILKSVKLVIGFNFFSELLSFPFFFLHVAKFLL